MTPAQLRGERETRAMNGAQFGAFLAEKLGRKRSYDRREVSAWETGRQPIPEAVERVLLALALAALNANN